jgi:glycosyltransferase involved in cell wall biosynthesis
MKRTLVEGKGVPAGKVHVIPLWARPELTPIPGSQTIRHELGVGDGELLLLYAGNMGMSHPLDPILEAATRLRDQLVHFLFIGDGVRRPPMVERVAAENLSRVAFLPFQPEARFAQIVSAADACFVVLKPGLEGLSIPSRSYTFLSAGRPLITIMSPQADVARLAIETGCGWNITSSDELTDLIRGLVADRADLERRGRAARDVYRDRFRRDLAIQEYASLLRGAAGADDCRKRAQRQ